MREIGRLVTGETLLAANVVEVSLLKNLEIVARTRLTTLSASTRDKLDADLTPEFRAITHWLFTQDIVNRLRVAVDQLDAIMRDNGDGS